MPSLKPQKIAVAIQSFPLRIMLPPFNYDNVLDPAQIPKFRVTINTFPLAQGVISALF
jgi:hypothetical protein